MAWIELHQEFRDHPKVARLAARLNIDYCLAQAYLINLWLWACSYARNGDLTTFSHLEITEASKSKVEPSLFVQVLIETRWLDKKGEKIVVHDWKKYGLRILEASRRRTDKHRKNNDLSGNPVTLQKRDGNVLLSYLTLLSIPSNHSLYSEEFSGAWGDWVEYRLQRKKPISDISAKQQIKFLSKQSNPIGCIEESIRNGWQGLFELKEKNGTHKNSNGQTTQYGKPIYTDEDNRRLAAKVDALQEQRRKQSGNN